MDTTIVDDSILNRTGLGMGLYVCKTIVQQLGGSISVESPGLN